MSVIKFCTITSLELHDVYRLQFSDVPSLSFKNIELLPYPSVSLSCPVNEPLYSNTS